MNRGMGWVYVQYCSVRTLSEQRRVKLSRVFRGAANDGILALLPPTAVIVSALTAIVHIVVVVGSVAQLQNDKGFASDLLLATATTTWLHNTLV